MDDARSLWLAQKALMAAIVDQRALQELAPAVGLSPFPYSDNEERLKLRLLDVQKRIIDLEP